MNRFGFFLLSAVSSIAGVGHTADLASAKGPPNSGAGMLCQLLDLA